MKNSNLFILLLIVLIGVLGVLIFQQEKLPQKQAPPAPAHEQQQIPIKKPIVHYPVPAAEQPSPAAQEPPPQQEPAPLNLPSLEEGEQALQQVWHQLVTDTSLFDLLISDNLIQRLVFLIDNLPEKRLPHTYLPIKAPGGHFIVSGTDTAPQTSSRNHKRYLRYVKLLENIDPDLAVKIYTHFYPLFQKAYEQLGYKNAYFNDRLIFTLDHLLETPDPKEPIQLTQPSVLYRYADPLLENRSAGQKILIRIGPENRKRVLNVLAAYRERLINLHP